MRILHFTFWISQLFASTFRACSSSVDLLCSPHQTHFLQGSNGRELSSKSDGQNVRVWDLSEAITGVWDPAEKEKHRLMRAKSAGAAKGKKKGKDNVYRDIEVRTQMRHAL